MVRQKAKASPEARLPFVTMAELLEGIWGAAVPSQEDTRLGATLGATPIVYPDEETLGHYARISFHLRRQGRSIPMNDLWNASVALRHDLPLLADDAHFARVPGLKFLPVR